MVSPRGEQPLIVQGDLTVLLDVDTPSHEAARGRLARFAELVKSPEHIHTYRITPLSIWNACAAGVGTAEMGETLDSFSRHPVPEHIPIEIRDFASRYGRLRLLRDPGGLRLSADDALLAEEVGRNRLVAPLLRERLSPAEFRVDPADRGRIKQVLVKIGFPAEDLAGYAGGEELPLDLRPSSVSGLPFRLRPYQEEASDIFHAGGSERGGSGVIVLPCGAGKTIVGMGCMARLRTSTLILTTSVTAVRQWVAELLDKTTLRADQIGEYTGAAKEIRPVTVSTYQIMTYRPSALEDFTHMGLFDRRDWGLIIYDEVHLLPAPVFQATAGLQARRRLGLTATLVREDGREGDVFALIGPKKADVPWKAMERQGWIARAVCTEIRVPMPDAARRSYALADARARFRIASENPLKEVALRRILADHPGEPTLIIAMYVEQIRELARSMGIPVMTGSTPQARRDALYADFKEGRVPVLAVSKIANFAVDLPDAAVAIQVSGTFGSRQEEAQRLGRILRPKPGSNQAHFYTLVSHRTIEQDYALKRQLFLCEQGYQYAIRDDLQGKAEETVRAGEEQGRIGRRGGEERRSWT